MYRPRIGIHVLVSILKMVGEKYSSTVMMMMMINSGSMLFCLHFSMGSLKGLYPIHSLKIRATKNSTHQPIARPNESY